MHKIGPFEIDGGVLCEAIRQEINNKISIIGAFVGDIIVKSFPATFPISAYVQMKSVELGNFHVQFRIAHRPSESFSQLSADVEVIKLGWSAFPLPTVPLHCDGPGKIVLEIKVGDGDWECVLERDVTTGEIVPS